ISSSSAPEVSCRTILPCAGSAHQTVPANWTKQLAPGFWEARRRTCATLVTAGNGRPAGACSVRAIPVATMPPANSRLQRTTARRDQEKIAPRTHTGISNRSGVCTRKTVRRQKPYICEAGQRTLKQLRFCFDAATLGAAVENRVQQRQRKTRASAVHQTQTVI